MIQCHQKMSHVMCQLASLGFAFFEVEDYLWLFLKQGKVQYPHHW